MTKREDRRVKGKEGEERWVMSWLNRGIEGMDEREKGQTVQD